LADRKVVEIRIVVEGESLPENDDMESIVAQDLSDNWEEMWEMGHVISAEVKVSS